MKVNFNLRSPNAKKQTPINAILRWNGQRLVYSTGERILPKNWDKTNQRPRKGSPFAERIMERLEIIEYEAKNVRREFVNRQRKEPHPIEAREALTYALTSGEQFEASTLIEFVEQYIEASHGKVGKNGLIKSKRTIQKYNTTLKRLIEYSDHSSDKLELSAIDYDTLDNFYDFLTVNKSYALNTVSKYVKNAKHFIKEASHKFPINQNYLEFIAPEEESDSVYLNEDELELILNLDLSDKTALENARDLFLVGCWTGLRYEDFTSISKSEIDNDRIRKRTDKTRELVVIPITPVLQSILHKYEAITPNSLPVKISNPRLNKNIKNICKLIPELQREVKKTTTISGKKVEQETPKYLLISTHTARRSFATNMYKRGLPSISIRSITGHRTESAFLRYIRASADEHADIIAASFK